MRRNRWMFTTMVGYEGKTISIRLVKYGKSYPEFETWLNLKLNEAKQLIEELKKAIEVAEKIKRERELALKLKIAEKLEKQWAEENNRLERIERLELKKKLEIAEIVERQLAKENREKEGIENE